MVASHNKVLLSLSNLYWWARWTICSSFPISHGSSFSREVILRNSFVNKSVHALAIRNVHWKTTKLQTYHLWLTMNKVRMLAGVNNWQSQVPVFHFSAARNDFFFSKSWQTNRNIGGVIHKHVLTGGLLCVTSEVYAPCCYLSTRGGSSYPTVHLTPPYPSF